MGFYNHQCPKTLSGQNGRDADDAPSYKDEWRSVRLEELRSFMHELVLESSLRSAASRVGLGHEALRKFINGETARPHERSKRSMAYLFLERQKLSVAEHTTAPTAGPLKMLLPRGLGAASQEVRSLFEVLRGLNKPPPIAGDLERWLIRKLEEEYAKEAAYPVAKKTRKRRPPAESAET